MDATEWVTARDASIGLREALGAKYGGSSIDAFIDLMIWDGTLGVQPPYQVVIKNLIHGDAEAFIDLLIKCICEARLERISRQGIDVEVSISRAPCCA